jgi:hypothetical protein
MFNTLKKKSSATVTIPTKKASKPTAKPKTTAKSAKAQTIKPPKVKAHKTTVKAHQAKLQQHTQKPQFNMQDINLATTGDASGVHIHTLHQGNPVHKFSLLRSDYTLWNRMSPDQKYAYVKLRIDHSTFGHDMNIIHAIILTTCQILNTLFAQAQAQQAHAHHRNMF